MEKTLKRQWSINAENKIAVGNPVIALLSVYLVWQMGVLFFSGNSLSLFGRVPIPIEEPLTTIIIAVGYISTIIFHYFGYRYTVPVGKFVIIISLIATICMFFALPSGVLAAAFYVTAFCCVFFIGTTYSVEAGQYDNSTVLRSNFIGTIIGCSLVAIIQNDFFKFSFFAFNILSIVLLVLLFIGYSLLPNKMETKRYPIKELNGKLPKLMLLGLYASPFISTLLLVFSSTIAETVTHGIFMLYLSGAVGGVIGFFIYKKWKISPFKISSFAFAFCNVGFVFAALSFIYKPLVYVAIVLIGANILIANMIGFFANTAFRYRPSKMAGNGLVLIGLVVAMLQAALLEVFRNDIALLFVILSVIATGFIVFYVLVEPSLSYRFKAMQIEKQKAALSNADSSSKELVETAVVPQAAALDDKKNAPSCEEGGLNLSLRDKQIVEYILEGYTVPEIAAAMCYSEESIKTYKKNIYAKLDVHSKRELFAAVAAYKDND